MDSILGGGLMTCLENQPGEHQCIPVLSMIVDDKSGGGFGLCNKQFFNGWTQSVYSAINILQLVETE